MQTIEELVQGYEYADCTDALTHDDRADLERLAILWLHHDADAMLDIFATEGDLTIFNLYAAEAACKETYAEGFPGDVADELSEKALIRLARFVTHRCRRVLERRLSDALREQHHARMDDEPTFAEEAADLCRMDYTDRLEGVKGAA